MPKIRWYGPEEGGPNSTAARVSHTTPVVKALQTVAHNIAREASFLLDVRAKERTGDAQIKVLQQKLDYYTYLRDPNNKGAAQGIENGHWTLGYYRRRDGTLGAAEGPIRNGKFGDSGGARWVEGLHVLRDASEKVRL